MTAGRTFYREDINEHIGFPDEERSRYLSLISVQTIFAAKYSLILYFNLFASFQSN